MPKENPLEDNSALFKVLPGDDSHLCLPRQNIMEILGELNRCTYARKGMLELIKVADKDYKERKK